MVKIVTRNELHARLGANPALILLEALPEKYYNDWHLPDAGSSQLPLSTTTTVDLTQVKERFALRPQALAQVDKVLER